MRERYFCAMPGADASDERPMCLYAVLFLRCVLLPIYLLCRSITPQAGIKAEKS